MEEESRQSWQSYWRQHRATALKSAQRFPPRELPCTWGRGSHGAPGSGAGSAQLSTQAWLHRYSVYDCYLYVYNLYTLCTCDISQSRKRTTWTILITIVCYIILLMCKDTAHKSPLIWLTGYSGREDVPQGRLQENLMWVRSSAFSYRPWVPGLLRAVTEHNRGGSAAHSCQCATLLKSGFCSEPLAWLRFSQNCTAIWGSSYCPSFLLSLCRHWAYL